MLHYARIIKWQNVALVLLITIAVSFATSNRQDRLVVLVRSKVGLVPDMEIINFSFIIARSVYLSGMHSLK